MADAHSSNDQLTRNHNSLPADAQHSGRDTVYASPTCLQAISTSKVASKAATLQQGTLNGEACNCSRAPYIVSQLAVVHGETQTKACLNNISYVSVSKPERADATWPAHNHDAHMPGVCMPSRNAPCLHPSTVAAIQRHLQGSAMDSMLVNSITGGVWVVDCKERVLGSRWRNEAAEVMVVMVEVQPAHDKCSFCHGAAAGERRTPRQCQQLMPCRAHAVDSQDIGKHMNILKAYWYSTQSIKGSPNLPQRREQNTYRHIKWLIRPASTAKKASTASATHQLCTWCPPAVAAAGSFPPTGIKVKEPIQAL